MFLYLHVVMPLTDIHRTFPDNVLFRSSSDSGLQTALYNVLLAYGHHNKDVGYCQVGRLSHHTYFSGTWCLYFVLSSYRTGECLFHVYLNYA